MTAKMILRMSEQAIGVSYECIEGYEDIEGLRMGRVRAR
jgi:hypothetical protein